MLFNESLRRRCVLLLQVEFSTLQIPLLLVEFVLLLTTVSLLVLNRKEQKSREKMMSHFASVADVITRQEYFVAVIDAYRRAEKRLSGSVTGSPPTREEGGVIQEIVDAVSDSVKRGVEVRFLLPLVPDRLQMGKRYKAVGATVRFHPALVISDARYMLVDDKMVLVGVPERKGKNEPTRKGYAIPSESVTYLFKVEFESYWSSAEARSYDQYLTELVTQARTANPSISVDLIADNLGIDKGDVGVLSGPS
ncbi:MAG: hypothetical protein OK422_03435 [Thaumarchaeota archaeon]|nr:hypothetical protein [Nitrososphaerota archaeon]